MTHTAIKNEKSGIEKLK